jgi:hypothetical protein
VADVQEQINQLAHDLVDASSSDEIEKIERKLQILRSIKAG